MKKLFLFLFITALIAGCKTPQNSVSGFQYDGSKVCVNGNVIIYAPTMAQLDSALRAIPQNIISFEHIKDSANAHFYKYILCSPPLNQNK